MLIYNVNENNLIDTLKNIDSFEIFENGKQKKILINDKKFNKIKTSLEDLFSNSKLMPAFGVSLHNETLKEMMKGNWLQINFSNEINISGMLFNALLIKLEKTNGVNLIRLYNNKYEGRCIYLDFEEEIDLNDLIKKIC